MTIYERNLEALKVVHKDIYEEIENAHNPGEQVLVGDALNGEKFLAVIRGEAITPLNSTYDPSHEAERYVLQFDKEGEDSIVMVFGFGNGAVLERMLSDECPVDICIVYEPSVAIFLKALEEFDLTKLLSDARLLLFVEGVNSDQMEYHLVDLIDYSNWRNFSFKELSQYIGLFPAQRRMAFEMFERVRDNNHAAMNTLIAYAKAGVINEVTALKWMIDCKTISGMRGAFPTDMPVIIVAAGPSLEKNIEVLKQAKGRAFILCVDTAIPFLYKHGIIPDMACTIDAQKGPKHFDNPAVHGLPIAVSTDSNYVALRIIENINPYYISTTNDYYQDLFLRKGHDVGYFDGGGSVGTTCFKLAVTVGFRTVILIGQDLSFKDDKQHAGKEQYGQMDLSQNMVMVDGYYGGKVVTRGDYKTYIDWYNLQIPKLENCVVINATEGGAMLKGAIQMPLQEAIDTYCKNEYDVAAILEQIPKVWAAKEEKQELYEELKQKYQFFKGFFRRVKDGLESTERAIFLLQRKNYHPGELKQIDKKLNSITREVEEKKGMVLLIKRMIETHITLNDDLNETEEDLEKESIRLYEKMKKYLGDLLEALEEMLPIWESVLQEITEIYQLDS